MDSVEARIAGEEQKIFQSLKNDYEAAQKGAQHWPAGRKAEIGPSTSTSGPPSTRSWTAKWKPTRASTRACCTAAGRSSPWWGWPPATSTWSTRPTLPSSRPSPTCAEPPAGHRGGPHGRGGPGLSAGIFQRRDHQPGGNQRTLPDSHPGHRAGGQGDRPPGGEDLCERPAGAHVRGHAHHPGVAAALGPTPAPKASLSPAPSPARARPPWPPTWP